MNWYALYCRSNAERRIRVQLEDKGIEAFYPHTVTRSTDGRRDVERKFFPGYLFARFDRWSRLPVIEVPQVLSIVGCGSEPEAIPDREMEPVRLLSWYAANTRDASLSECLYMAQGDRVKVSAGPLKGLAGFVSREKGKSRVVVSITSLGRSMSAEVDRGSLVVEEALRKAA